MGPKFNKLAFVVVALALLETSTAWTEHVVGDSLGWVVPPGGATPYSYSTWAANNTFNVTDVLVFNFQSGRHDVAEVTKAAFDACNTTSPISRETNSPVNINLYSAGDHYYISTFNNNCARGQKLAINVTSVPSSQLRHQDCLRNSKRHPNQVHESTSPTSTKV